MFVKFKTPIDLQKELESFFHLPFYKKTSSPLINMVGKKDEVMVSMEIPGLSSEEIDISVQDNLLTVGGDRKQEMPEQLKIKERRTGKFERKIKLPFKIDTENVVAKYENGILSVTLRQAEEDKPKKVEIKS